MKKKVKEVKKMMAELKPVARSLTLVVEDVKPEHCFQLVDGRNLRNLMDLVWALDEMNDDIFRFHVNEYKNDFARWIKDVMSEGDLAEKLDSTKDRNQHKAVLLMHLFRKAN